MKDRLFPSPDTTDADMHSADLIISYGGAGHEQEYLVGLPGLIGHQGDAEIPRSISRDIQKRMGTEREVANRGSRLEILGQRDDAFVVSTLTAYFEELRQLV